MNLCIGTLQVPLLVTHPTNQPPSIYLRSSHLNMYTFSPQNIHPLGFTSHLLGVAYKIDADWRAPNLQILPIASTFVFRLTGVCENKNPVSLTYLVLEKATATTPPTTMKWWVKRGFTPLLYQAHGTFMNHRKAEIIYHTFVYVCVRVCMCACVCLLGVAG